MQKLMFVLSMLTACSIDCGTDCPVPPGAGCQSLSQINDQVIENPSGEDGIAFDKPSCEQKEPITLKSNGKTITHVPEQVVRVWLKGYQTSQGDYIDANYAYVRLQNGRWIKR